ncbi:MAG: phage tail protein [Pseudomonadota bacterium]
MDTSQVYGVFDGYVLGDIASPRSALEVLVNLYRLDVFEQRGILVFRSRGRDVVTRIPTRHMVLEEDNPRLTVERAQESDIPAHVRLSHMDPATDFQSAQSEAHRVNGGNLDIQSFNAPIIADDQRMTPILEQWLGERSSNRETIQFGLDWSYSPLRVGDLLSLDVLENTGIYRITGIEEGRHLAITAVATTTQTTVPLGEFAAQPRAVPARPQGKTQVTFLDLPLLPASDENHGNRIAVTKVPNGGGCDVFASPLSSGFRFRQRVDGAATQGVLTSQLPPTAVVSRWHSSAHIHVKLSTGTLSSAAEELVLSGNNALAVEKAGGQFEIVQFRHAALAAPNEYRLEGLLRGQAGTENQAYLKAPSGARIVLINKAVTALELIESEMDVDLNWRIAPVGRGLTDHDTIAVSHTPGLRALQPYSPVHLRAHRHSGGDLSVSWVRRDRKNSDSWSLAEVPMSEEAERYQLTLTQAGAEPLIQQVLEPQANISNATLQAHFGPVPTSLELAVAQISAAVGPGPAATITLT